MKIIHVVSSLQVGGAERFVIDLAVQQAEQHDVHILSMSAAGEPLEAECQAVGITVHCIPNTGILSQLSQLKQTLKDFNVVHVHSSYSLPRILLASRLVKGNIKLIYTRHNERVHQSTKWVLIYRFASRWIARIVFVAEKARSNFTLRYPQLINKCEVVLNGVLPIDADKPNTEKLHVGHVGRFVPLKSQHLLVKAAACLPADLQAKLCLHFYGTGPEMEKVKNLAKQHKATLESHFHGHESDRQKIYSSFNVLAVTSETEGLSLAILEAMASKMPIIASNVGGNPELVSHEENGYLYPYGDIEALSECLKALVNEPAKRDAFGEHSYRKYLQQFSMRSCAEHYLKLYQTS